MSQRDGVGLPELPSTLLSPTAAGPRGNGGPARPESECRPVGVDQCQCRESQTCVNEADRPQEA